MSAGSVTQVTPVCAGYDDTYVSTDFSPNIATIGGTPCVDAAPNWIYEIDHTPVSAAINHFKMSIDSVNNKIWMKGITGGTVYGAFTISIKGYL